MNDTFVSLREPWGSLQINTNYKVFKQGSDYLQVKAQGTIFFVPKYLITGPVRKVEFEEELEDYSELYKGY